MSLVQNNSQPKVWMNGHYMPAQKSNDGSWFVEIDGKKVQVDPNDLFGINDSHKDNPWKKLNNDCAEMVENHTKWLNYWKTKQEKANSMYDFGRIFLKKSNDKYQALLKNAGCDFSELNKTQQKEAKVYLEDMRSGRNMKNRAVSDSIFYGRMTMDEIEQININSNFQSLAIKMQNA